MTSEKDAGSILLPQQDVVFRNLRNAKRFAIDIGGSLTKIAYYSTVSYKRAMYSLDEQTKNNSDDTSHPELPETDVEVVARLHFIKFETKHIETCLSFIKQNLIDSPDFMRKKSIKATGGGAYKYTDLLTNTLGLMVDKEDEMECLIKGCNFVLKNIPDEVFEYRRHMNPEYRFHGVEPNMYPYLLVNIGSGVSIMKVESESSYERIGGSAMGGGTFWGLGSLLTNAKGFDELLELAERGDHRNVDMLVKDIYGGDYSGMGLPGDLIACSFGKAIHSSRDKNFNPGQFAPEDIARSLLFMISNDIGQLACLYAMMHGFTKVYFGGYFLRAHFLSMHTISYAINYWSKGKVQALFLRHEGYLAAIGAFLKCAEEYDTDKYSWGENYAGSSGLSSPIPTQLSFQNNAMIDQLEIDRFDWQLVYCPLLRNPGDYIPDTVDLTQDPDSRDYWLVCFEDAVDKFVERAVVSQVHRADAHQRAKVFKEKYITRLHHLRGHPFAFGSLTVRSLLDMREHCLKEFDFPDPYLKQKRLENEQALKLLKQRIVTLDSMKWDERQSALIVGLLAGNVFDWGAKEVAKMMEASDFGFNEAKHKLEVRPWLIDDLEKWIIRLRGPPHACAALFVDNSGMDVVLGVLPFARELLQRKTKINRIRCLCKSVYALKIRTYNPISLKGDNKILPDSFERYNCFHPEEITAEKPVDLSSVLLCANSKPALNDVTYQELTVLIRKVAVICEVINQALVEGQLMIMDSGQSSPCLDLSRLNLEVAETMLKHGTDLIVLEGMGRAVHTNLNAAFKCESIKAAVLKNQWLANRLGGGMFSVIFKYEAPS